MNYLKNMDKAKNILDSADFRLLEALKSDARLTVKELAGTIGKSATATYERVKRLESMKAIRGYHADVDPRFLGKEFSSFVSIRLKEHESETIRAFEASLGRIPEVREWYHITGPHDYMIKVEMESIAAYHQFINERLASIPNIATVQSLIVLNHQKV